MRVKTQAILAKEKSVNMMISSWEWRVIPSIASMLTKLDEVDSSNFGRIFMFLNVFLIHAVLIIFQKVFLLFSLLFFFLDSFKLI